MHIKRFTAPTIKEALREVKREFGDNALLLGNKRIGAGMYEVIAAIDYDLSTPVDLNLSDGAYGGVLKHGKGGGSSGGGHGVIPGGGPVGLPPQGSFGIAALEKELKELRDLKEFYLSVMSQAAPPLSKMYSSLESELLKEGVDRRLAQKIIMNALKASRNDSDMGTIRDYMKRKVGENIGTCDPAASGGVLAFIGPSGVGKTTTLTKLAAVYSLRKKKKVAMVTTDTKRIGAAEELKLYGRIMGLPVEVARNNRELALYLGMHADKDLVLVDTAGRKPGGEQADDMKAISSVSPRARFNLVLSSQMRDDALYDSIKGFTKSAVDTLTFTKLDEGARHGQILNSIMLAKKPVAYLSAGQRVPDDIEFATKERILKFFMPNQGV